MATTVNLRKPLDRKAWEFLNPCPSASAAGSILLATPAWWVKPMIFTSVSTSVHYLYDVTEDAWLQLPSGTLGAHVAGTTGDFHPYGPVGTATAGGASTLTTNLTIPGSLAGYKIRITGGTGVGQERTILNNTFGANSVITTTATWTVTPDATSVYLILSGRFWVLGATGAAVVWKYYDIATNTWTVRSVTAGPGSTWATDGACTVTSTTIDAAFQTATATAGAASTITLSTANWTVNQWANMQVRITGGTGAGQIRVINSNTATVITVSAAWTVTPDATSVFVLEGVDDWIYVMGNNAVTLFRYAINGTAGLSVNAQATGDTWITISPGAARGGAPGAGVTANWIARNKDVSFTTTNTILNGRRIYSFRGANSSTLDYYDIPSNAWVSALVYNRQAELFTTGTGADVHNGIIYINQPTRFYKFDPAFNNMDALSTLGYPQGASVIGNKIAIMAHIDGAVDVPMVYYWRQSGTEFFRLLCF